MKHALAQMLQETASTYQDACIIPHCPACAKPCCKLDSLVLELNWKQVRTFWRLDESRSNFDRRLASGNGPEEIREGNGLYYAHRKACPAYDEAGRTCNVYGQPIKPAGCTDFPVYQDGNDIMADLRCEAVDIAKLKDWITEKIGPEVRIKQSADKDFPFLVSLSIYARNTPNQRKRG